MEDFLLKSWVQETCPLLQGRQFSGVRSDGEMNVTLDFGRRGGNLLFHASPGRLYYCLDPKLSVPQEDSLRALPATPFLRGVGIIGMEKVKGDRIVWVHLDPKDRVSRLVLELIPSAPNLILLDRHDRVQWMLSADRNRRRALRAGSFYQPPRQSPRTSLDDARLQAPSPVGPLEKWLMHHVDEMSPVLASELVCRSGGEFECLMKAQSDYRREPLAPRIYSEGELGLHDWQVFEPWRDLIVSPVRLLSQQHRHATRFNSLNAALDRFAQLACEAIQFQALHKSLRGRLTAQAIRQDRAIRAAEADCRRMEDPSHFRLCGELILANLDRMKTGWDASHDGRRKREIAVINYYAPGSPEMRIEVDPGKSPQANAESYFKAYRKARRGFHLQAARLSKHRRELEETMALQARVEKATDLEALTRLMNECFGESGKVSRRRREPQHRRGVQFRVYLSSDGHEILIGKSAKGNEELTFRLSRAHDIWLHAADYTGSHVVVRNPTRKQVPRNSLIEAAQLAAYFSSARSQTKVEVRYTEQKYVQRVKGAGPGLVRLQRFQTLLVAPRRRIGKEVG